jgi:hypothetical protein
MAKTMTSCSSAVDAVGEDEDHPTTVLMLERRNPDVDRVPEGRRPRLLQLGPENLDEVALAVREAPWIHLNPVREAADPRLVPGKEQSDELLRRRPDEPEVANHAAAAIEHQHDRDGLDPILEERHFLELAVVVDLEVVARE